MWHCYRLNCFVSQRPFIASHLHASFNIVDMRFNDTGGTAAVRVAQQTCMVNNNVSRFVSSVNENECREGRQKLNEN